MVQKQDYILELIERLIKCCEDLLGKKTEDIRESFKTTDFLSLVNEIKEGYETTNFPAKHSRSMAEIVSVKASAVRVSEFAAAGDERGVKKLEFELLPLLENLRMNYYYYTWCAEDPDKKRSYREKEYAFYYRNRYLEEAKRTGKYKYDLSIFVTGYNKAEYTEACVESLKKYLPSDISCELILVNHGSTDGTKEYFESQKPDKQFDIEVNGGGSAAASRIVEGKYILSVSNDVLVMKNTIKNIYTCITSDEKIGWVVPTTPNVSNQQTIDTDYENVAEMFQFAEKNNISDSKRWEEKPRLCNPIDIKKTEVWFDVIGKIVCMMNQVAFPDDQISCMLRRQGYKLILAKDAYCYHFGSVTISREIDSQLKARISYCKGRIKFIKELGMDPWGYGMAYDTGLIEAIEPEKCGKGRICGINAGLGGNPLKIKDVLKERGRVHDCEITYLTQYDMNWEDVKGLGDVSYKIEDWTQAIKVLNGKYDVILLENGVTASNISQVGALRSCLSENGVLVVRLQEEIQIRMLRAICPIKKIATGEGCKWLFMDSKP